MVRGYPLIAKECASTRIQDAVWATIVCLVEHTLTTILWTLVFWGQWEEVDGSWKGALDSGYEGKQAGEEISLPKICGHTDPIEHI